MNDRPTEGAAPETGLPEAEAQADDRAFRDARARDGALLLPLAGLLLFSPPLISLFASEARVFGAPVAVVYLFATWAALVAVAFALSRRLGGGEAGDDAP